MRLLIPILVVASAAAACNGAQTPPPANGLVATDNAGAARASTPPPVATEGRMQPADAPREAVAAAFREVTIPAGTSLPVVLDTSVGSDTSRVEQPVTAHLARPISVRGETVLAEGSRVTGVVTDATRSGKVKGLARVGLRFDSLTPRGDDERYDIRTSAVGRTAAATKKNDALKIGAPAAGGAIVGALFGGKKGALIGTAAGGGAGTAVVMSTRGKEVHLPKGAALTLRLAAPVTVKVRG